MFSPRYDYTRKQQWVNSTFLLLTHFEKLQNYDLIVFYKIFQIFENGCKFLNLFLFLSINCRNIKTKFHIPTGLAERRETKIHHNIS